MLLHFRTLVIIAVCACTSCQVGARPTAGAAPMQATSATLVMREIAPQKTDPAIDDWIEPHLVVLDPTIVRQQRLFVFFSGSFGKPQNQRLLLEQAARSGYHAIGLRYPNSWTVNQLCDPTGDVACYGDVRSEIITGVDRSSLVTVSPPNAINNRLTKLLLYLATAYPTEGWGQFLDGQGLPAWSLITAAGHSQGGGHAAMLGKQHALARVCMFSSPDDMLRKGGSLIPASWLSAPSATPINRFYGLASELEDGYSGINIAWATIGIASLGAAVLADTAQPPYNGTHMLTTRLEPAQPGAYHGSTAVDRNTPLLADGTPALAPAWQYLCFPAADAASTVSLPLIIDTRAIEQQLIAR